MFERFTDRARAAVNLAEDEARILSHNYIGTEHILLGLLRQGTGIAGRVLEELGIFHADVRADVEEIIGVGKTPPRRHIPFTPRAKKILELSLREALQLGHNYIGTEHILLGTLREAQGVAAQILVRHGLMLPEIREKVVEALAAHGVQARAVGENVRPSSHRSRRDRSRSPAAEGPICASCQAPLIEAARYRVVDVPEHDGEAQARVLFLYCSGCGATIDDLILPEE